MSHLTRVDDRWIWLGFGIFFILAAKGIRYAIQDIVRLTEIDDYDVKKTSEAHFPENELSLENLGILADSPDPNIANAAITLITERFFRDQEAYRAMVADIEQSHDDTLRQRAKQAFNFLRESTVGSSHRMIDGHSWSPTSASRSTSPSMPLLEDIPRSGPEEREWLIESIEEVIVPSEDNPVAGWTSVPRERPVTESISDLERRRRRREAMVLRVNDGGVEETDIVRPTMRR